MPNGTRPCRDCGRQILVVLGPKGRYVPLEKCSHAYRVNQGDRHAPATKVEDVWISHFLTCRPQKKGNGE